MRLSDRRAIAFLEFALIAPALLVLMLAGWNIACVMLVWQQLNAAAGAIAQAAEKLSVSGGAIKASLTATQMQNAMSTIYAAIPGLSLGSGTGMFTGSFAVTLSSVVYLPLCQQSAGCTPASTLAQTPYTLWSSYLTEGGSQLNTTGTLRRACGALTAVSQFPDDSTQLTKMVDATKVAGGSRIILTPQVVADVQYVFTPTLSWLLSPTTLWASATLPTPTGGTDQEITFNSTAPTGNVISCTLP